MIGQIHSLGCVDATCPGKFISFLKLELNDARDFHLALSLRVNYDRTWEVVGTDLSLNPATLATFPKVMATLRGYYCLSLMAWYCGNNDAKYEVLIEKTIQVCMGI